MMLSLSDTLDFGPTLDVAARSSASASTLVIPENQDNLVLIDATGRAVILRNQQQAVAHVPNWPAGHVRLAVLDGMGGHGHGRQAAEAAADGILHMPACRDQQELDNRLDTLHHELQVLFAADDDEHRERRPGTTLTLLELRPGQAPLLYHVGDSRLYEVSGHEIRPLTVDHVPATAFVMTGQLDEMDWWQQVHGEHRPQISQAFILGNAFGDQHTLADELAPLDQRNLPPFLGHLADRRALQPRQDAVYLLATDGFWACAQPAEWVTQWPALFGGPTPAGTVLRRLFDNFVGSPPPGLHIDNLTAIALRFKPHDAAPNIDETALPES